MDSPPSVFISYSHADETWKDKLRVQLDVLAGVSLLEVWDDRRIEAGDDWFPEIERALNAARVAVLLISAKFLTSNFIRKVEVPRLLLRRENEGLRIVPVLIHPCPWKKVEWLTKVQMRPLDAREIAGGTSYQIDKDFAAITEEIDDLLGPRPTPDLMTGARSASGKIDLSALPSTGRHFFGRKDELVRLDEAWASASTNTLSLVGWGGVGKSALVNHWLGEMAQRGYENATKVFGWSFYSQGSRETETSADEFFKTALAWFGDPDPQTGSPWQKGERLAGLIRKERTLLILDGLEPLQNPPGIEGGKVKDPALGELIRHLTADNLGLCVVATRIEVSDIADWRHTTAPVIELDRLATAAGSALLQALGVHGEPEELTEAVESVGGHALTLNLLGTYLRDILDRDVRRWREAGLADPGSPDGGRAQQVMAAYDRWFAGRPEVAILRLLGLFDRPARRDLVDVLRSSPVIGGLTEAIAGAPENEWRWALARLRQARLIEDEVGMIDVHPLVREHFGDRLKRERPDAWRAGHGRLYENLRDSAKELPNTLAEMAPLFQAVHHGCQAGRHQEALDEVFLPRIRMGDRGWSIYRLGAFGADLAALAGLFAVPWNRPISTLSEPSQGLVLNEAALDLRALGRLSDAVAPMSASLDRSIAEGDWRNAAISASNISGLHLTLGHVPAARVMAAASVEHADQSRDALSCMVTRTTWADALHQAGDLERPRILFEEAEAIQAAQTRYPLLNALQGFRYSDFLLALGRATDVRARAQQTSDWALSYGLLLGIALDQLSLGRAALALGEQAEARAQLDGAVDSLRKAGHIDEVPRGLLARAVLFRKTAEFVAARRDLDEAMRIAERSEMRLFQCDAYLGYARLALVEGDRDAAREHLAKAKRLVDQTGYGRRRPEVEELAVRAA